jgi:hypothetical protein
MRTNRISVFRFFLSIIFVSILSLSAQAQTGKITATVKDAKTGEAIYHATVKIVETKQGAYSNDKGVATISNIRPDENYTVEAKYAGFEPFAIKGVKVKSEQTTKLEFLLSSKHQDTIIVAADPLIDPSKVEISQKLSSKEITAIAGVQNVTNIVALSPGLTSDGSQGFSIHGSRGNQNSERMNGVETLNPVSGRESATQIAISKFAISEVSVATSGLGADKGNTTGGAISTTTRGGASDFEFMARFRTDVPSLYGTSGNGYKLMGQNYQTYELAVGGPITEDVKFFVTGKGESEQFHDAGPSDFTSPYTSQGLSVLDPAGNNLGHFADDHRYSRGATGNLSFDLFGVQFSADAVLSSVNRQIADWSYTYGDPSQVPARDYTDNIYTLRANISIGNTGILKVNGGYEASTDHTGKYDYSQGGGLFSPYKIYEAKDQFTYNEDTHTLIAGGDGIVDIYTPVSKQIADPRNPANIRNLSGAGINPFTGRVEGGGISASTNNPYGLFNVFLAAGNVQGFNNQTVDHIPFGAHYTDQFGSHGFDAGVDVDVYKINNYDNGLPWDANPFRDSFDVTPLIAGVYVQDKMEFSDITFQPGLRLDLYQPNNDHVISDPFHPLKSITTITNGDTVNSSIGNFTTAPVQMLLSPRLGITYAVSDKTTFNFTYGIYFDKPTFNTVLTATGGNFSAALARGNNIIGNGALKGETDEMINVGFNTALSDVMRLSVNGIYKKMKNISGIARITSPELPLGYYFYTDNEYGNYRGLELSLDKRMSDNFSARLNYTYSTTANTSSTATSNYSALVNQSADAEVAVLPLQPYPADWDRAHVAQLILTLLYGKGEGPKIGGIPILENFNFGTTTLFETGTPYTAFDIKGVQTGEHNGARQPSFIQTDATITRNIPLADIFGASMGHSSLEIQFEIYNLFNRNEAVTVYNTSGLADDDGKNEPYAGTTDFINDPTNASGNELDALGMLKYNTRWDLNKDGRVSLDEQTKAFNLQRSDKFARRTNYQMPRRFFFNFALHF